jgi:hypothetical protein
MSKSNIIPLHKKAQGFNALLVKLSISVFSNSRQDRQITDEVKLKKALGDGAGKWVKYKLPVHALEPITKFCGEVRTWHYNHTSPWDEGYRLLGGKVNAKYGAQMEAFKARFKELVDAFVDQYDDWIDQAKIMHGKTFEPSDYPSKDLMKSLFRIQAEYFPVPKPEHFNVEMQELYGNALTSITEKKIGEAVQDAWERLMKPVQAMAEKLADPKTIFRDTLVENVKEMVELMPSLNLTDDKKLKDAAAAIEKELAGLNPETLREDKVVRADVAKKAAALAARFGQLGKRKLAA